MEKEIIKTLRYFAQFSYAPSFSELHKFLAVKVTEPRLKTELLKMVRKGLLLSTIEAENDAKYTLGGYGKLLNETEKRNLISQNKLKRIMGYAKFLAKFRCVRLVGCSGSVSMLNADEDADIDLFVITEAERLWTARAVAVASALVTGTRRGRTTSHVKDTICLNMFMDEIDMTVPKGKRTIFVAHEVLQMKPLFDTGDTYNRFITANTWVFKFFPNSCADGCRSFRPSVAPRNSQGPSIGLLRLASPLRSLLVKPFTSLVECFAKKFQLSLINRHKTTEIVTDTQLWFFPDDFEKKVRA